jgi:hypothetical protein
MDKGPGQELSPLTSTRPPHVSRLLGGDIHQDGPVDTVLPQGEVTGPEDLRRGADHGLGQRAHALQVLLLR